MPSVVPRPRNATWPPVRLAASSLFRTGTRMKPAHTAITIRLLRIGAKVGIAK
jgi:hypothetical protein